MATTKEKQRRGFYNSDEVMARIRHAQGDAAGALEDRAGIITPIDPR